jgi:hypothetical protein
VGHVARMRRLRTRIGFWWENQMEIGRWEGQDVGEWIIRVRVFSRLRNITIVDYYYLFNCYMFRSYDHLQVDIYIC